MLLRQSKTQFANSIYVEQAVVIGDKRNFVSALIVPNFDAIKVFLTENSISCSSSEAIIDHEKVLKLFDSEIKNSMSGFAKFETVKKYKLYQICGPLKREITPSLKVVRKVVESNYQSVIDSMYN